MSVFFPYFGGKLMAARRSWYPQVAPDEAVIEPFAGSAGFALTNPRDVSLIESEPRIAAIWRWLIEEATPKRVLALPDFAPGQTVDDLDDLSQVERWFIGMWLTRAASPRKSPSKWMRSGIRPNCFWGASVRHRVAQQLPKVKHWRFREGDYTLAEDLIDAFVAVGRRAYVFVDPPYKGKCGRNYPHHATEASWYDDLAAWCQRIAEMPGVRVVACERSGADWLPFAPVGEIHGLLAKRGGASSAEAMWTGDSNDTSLG